MKRIFLKPGATLVAMPVKFDNVTIKSQIRHFNLENFIKNHCPYKEGQEVWVAEWWKIISDDLGNNFWVEYKDGEKKKITEKEAERYSRFSFDEFQPPQHMPREFSRGQKIVTGIKPVKVEDLNFDDITFCGFHSKVDENDKFHPAKVQFQDWWNKRSEDVWIIKVKEI